MLSYEALSSFPTQCPQCKHTNKNGTVTFQGVFILLKVGCQKCALCYYATLPTGHTQRFHITLSSDGKIVDYNRERHEWLADPLIRSIKNNLSIKARIDRKVNKPSRQVVLLNCLDSCYGHVIYKLLNVHRHLRDTPNIGLVVIIPAIFEWLVPEGIAETWTVKVSPNQLHYTVDGLDNFVKTQLVDFDEVYISKNYLGQDFTGINFEDYFKAQPFDLSNFNNQPFNVTFVLRENRFWLNSRLLGFLYLLSLKFDILPVFKGLFISRQNQLVNLTANYLHRHIENIRYYAIGVGASKKLNAKIIDLRAEAPTTKIELQWNRTAAGSHVVIGVHGSNMLIPSALAAGIIDIIPRFKIPNTGQDILMINFSKYTRFLLRNLDENCSPKLVAQHALSILNNFSLRSSTSNHLKW